MTTWSANLIPILALLRCHLCACLLRLAIATVCVMSVSHKSVLSQALEVLHEQLQLAANATHWAAVSSNSQAEVAVPAYMLSMLTVSVQGSMRSGMQSALEAEPQQLLLWLLQANKVSMCHMPSTCASRFHLHIVCNNRCLPC